MHLLRNYLFHPQQMHYSFSAPLQRLYYYQDLHIAHILKAAVIAALSRACCSLNSYFQMT